MGRPLDSRHSERSEESRYVASMKSLEFLQGPGIPLPADWYLTAFPLLTILTEILRFAQDDGGRREDIKAAPVMGRPLDSVILSHRRRISVRGEYEVIGILAGAWYLAPSRRLGFYSELVD